MAALIRKWKRVCAVGCTHGDLVHPGARQQVLDFVKRFKPEIRFDLGDLIDTAAFRAGAKGTKDEAHSTRDDYAAALRWLEEYEPTHIAWGNHDWRLYELIGHPNANKSDLAQIMWEGLTAAAAKIKAKTVPYDIEDGWFETGGVAWGHGYMFGMHALRDHAEMNGMPTVMVHLHRPHEIGGRTRRDTHSFCAGAIADDRKLTYQRRRRACLDHGPGIVAGEISDKEAKLWLARAKNGQKMHFPPGM